MGNLIGPAVELLIACVPAPYVVGPIDPKLYLLLFSSRCPPFETGLEATVMGSTSLANSSAHCLIPILLPFSSVPRSLDDGPSEEVSASLTSLAHCVAMSVTLPPLPPRADLTSYCFLSLPSSLSS